MADDEQKSEGDKKFSLINIDTEFISLFYKDLAQPSVQMLGKALGEISGLAYTATLKFKLKNEKARLLMEHQIEQIRKNLEEVDPKKIISVSPEVGIPILEKLEKTIHEKLSELYINLMSNASNEDFAGDVHPRFISIIEGLTPDELIILEKMSIKGGTESLTISGTIDLVKELGDTAFTSGSINSTHANFSILDRATEFEYNSSLSLPDKSRFYFHNLEGLGLISHSTNTFLSDVVYDEIAKHYEGFIISRSFNWSKNDTKKGRFDLTELAILFLKACKKQVNN